MQLDPTEEKSLPFYEAEDNNFLLLVIAAVCLDFVQLILIFRL